MNWHEFIVFELRLRNSKKTAACASVATLIPAQRALTESLHSPVQILFGCLKSARTLVVRFPSHKNRAR